MRRLRMAFDLRHALVNGTFPDKPSGSFRQTIQLPGVRDLGRDGRDITIKSHAQLRVLFTTLGRNDEDTVSKNDRAGMSQPGDRCLSAFRLARSSPTDGRTVAASRDRRRSIRAP